eukprot:CAMPEP_0181398326 /NCGR_PEP_ID=MMETSP1110-20121109/979_1 /TAXON_ID=174948 /ORGANISM="Symbiodinium sp., Strain CCMP421" /LENGTH=37 /DNA_ID= /DNA_START= /DNA_END= /DNA_ORIENTATION=
MEGLLAESLPEVASQLLAAFQISNAGALDVTGATSLG